MHIFRIFVVIAIALLIIFSPKIRSIIKGYSETSVDEATHNIQKVNKFSENFQRIIKEGDEEKVEAFIKDSLEASDKIQATTDKMNILKEICSYYLAKNDHEKVLKYTDVLYGLSKKENCYDLQAHSFYFYISSQMSLAQEEQDVAGKDLRMENAKKISLQGLHLIEEKEINNPLLEGKLYYVLGLSLIETSSSDLFQAEKMLVEAKEHFEKAKDQNGIFKANLKLAHIQFLQGEVAKAESILCPLKEENYLEASLQMQLDFMLSQIEAAKGQVNSAISLAEKACEVANEKERIRINQLISELKQVQEMQKEPL